MFVTTCIEVSFFLDRITKVNPVVGDIVKVYSHSFDGFYRAKILNIDKKDFYVSYIDFGNVEKVHSCDIFELSDELKKEVWRKTYDIYVLKFN